MYQHSSVHILPRGIKKMAILMGLLMLPCLLHAQKNKKYIKTDLNDTVQRQLVQDAAIASESGDLAKAEKLLTEALAIHHENEIAHLRSHLRVLKGDTAGYCEDLRWVAYGTTDANLKTFERVCIQRDTLPLTAAEYPATVTPGVTTAIRTHHRATGRTDHRFLDEKGDVVYAINTSETDTIFLLCDQMPQYPGGDQELFRFLGSTIKYPALALDNGLSGVVYVRFTVDTDGGLKDHQLVRGVHWSLEEEALRVARTMPFWQPGEHQGERVRVAYNLPIRFTLR